MNLYIVTIKFLPKMWSDNSLSARAITGRWIVKADSCVEALTNAAENRGETIEARAVKLLGNNNVGVYCIEYDGKTLYGLLEDK